MEDDADIIVVGNIGSGITLWVPKTPMGKLHMLSLPSKPWQHLGGNLVVPQAASPTLVKEAVDAGLTVAVREESIDAKESQ